MNISTWKEFTILKTVFGECYYVEVKPLLYGEKLWYSNEYLCWALLKCGDVWWFDSWNSITCIHDISIVTSEF